MSEYGVTAGEVSNEEIGSKAKEIIASGYNGKALIAFIDLLGFSSEILTNWKSEKSPLESIIKIKAFTTLAGERSKTESFLSDDDITTIAIGIYPKVITFSDSFIFITPIRDEDPNTIIANLSLLVSSIMELWKYSLEEGFTIRGAIDFGGIYHNELDLVGPSLIQAFNLESTVAKISRVIISDTVRILVDQLFDQIDPSLHDYLLKFFRLDIDNIVTFNPVLIFGYTNECEIEETIIKIERIVNKLHNHEAINKYQDLLQQLRSRNINPASRSIFINLK